MADLLFKLKEFRACLKTLKDTSYDSDNKEYLCHSQKQVYDFDCITRALYPKETPKSFDALLIVNQVLYCVEFKNQKPSDIKNDKLQGKLLDSQETLKRLFESVPKDNYDFIFCVVYKPEKGNFGKYKSHIGGTTDKFNLESKIKHIFKTNKVITNDVEFFAREFKRLVIDCSKT